MNANAKNLADGAAEREKALLEPLPAADSVNENQDDLVIAHSRENVQNRVYANTKVGKPPKKPAKKETDIPPELIPDREELEAFMSRNMDEFTAFLEYKGVKPKVIFGMHNYFNYKTGVICLSVKLYHDSKVKEGRSPAQFVAVALHEFAHVKRMLEEDLAGKYNILAQLEYEGKKRIPALDDATKYMQVTSAYRYYYNMLEDAIVNYLVMQHRWYGENYNSQSAKRNKEFRNLYVYMCFKIFSKVADGAGDYIYEKSDDPAAEEHKKVGPGEGNLVFRGEKDYQDGFDYNDAVPHLDRGNQYLIYFMKNQMLRSKIDDIHDPKENPEGKFGLQEDVSLALRKPLETVYETLLEKVMKKYQDKPDQLKRYLKFMSAVYKIPFYHEVDGEIVQGAPHLSENVVNPASVNVDKVSLNIRYATMMYSRKLKNVAEKLELDEDEMTFMDVFEMFKTHKKSSGRSWTFPLRFNQVESTEMMRNILEPIYTLLLILDDNFDIKAPPDSSPHPDGEAPEGSEDAEDEGAWEVGDKVINDDNNSPYKGRKGIITQVNYDDRGNVDSVNVEYFEEEDAKQAMADSPKKKDVFSGEEEQVFSPDKNLIIVAKKKLQKGGGKSKDKRKKQFEDDKPDEDKKEKGEPGEPGEAGEPGEEDSAGETDTDIDEYADRLKKMIEEDERQARVEKYEEAKKTAEYQQKKQRFLDVKGLEEEFKKLQEKDDFQCTREDIEKYLAMEEQIALYADKMAKEWIKIISNITTRIEKMKEKYFTSGKVDMRKLQHHFPGMKYGENVENKLVHTRVIDVIKMELKPKMLRCILLIDNSGSMTGHLDNVRMAMILLNKSLSSLRVAFKEIMKDTLGEHYSDDIDLVCDVQIWSFDLQVKLIKDFDIKKFDFLDNEKLPRPKNDKKREITAAIKAFKRIDATGGGTYDLNAWRLIYGQHMADPNVARLLAQGKMTEVLCQFSDGAIADEPEPPEPAEDEEGKKPKRRKKPTVSGDTYRAALKQMGVLLLGLAIGSEGAKMSLQQRFDGKKFKPEEIGQPEPENGEEKIEEISNSNVFNANTPAMIVDQFGKALQRAVRDQIENPMMAVLDKIDKSVT